MNCPTCNIPVSDHPANRCMDAWVAEKVMGWHLNKEKTWWRDKKGQCEGVGPDTGWDVWSPSTSITDAWKVVEKLQKWLSWDGADGFFMLLYVDWADHGVGTISEECSPLPKYDYEQDDEEDDPMPWSAHIHAGLIAEGGASPKHWSHCQRFCARAPTPALAICRAALMAVGEEEIGDGKVD